MADMFYLKRLRSIKNAKEIGKRYSSGTRHNTMATIPEAGHPSSSGQGGHVTVPLIASGVLWAKHNLLCEPGFGRETSRALACS
eukprot:15461404-Alexandrium_andersonii.AAC.1